MFFKEPTEVLPYEIDYLDWLGGATISTSTWAIPAGITKDDDSHTNTTTRIVLSGGTWGETYELTNTIEASNGETEARAILIRIQRQVAYCSSTEVRRRAQTDTATTAALTNAELDALIEQASRMFDRACGVPDGYFNPVAIPIPVARTFYGDGSNFLRLPPYVAGTLTIALPEGYETPTFVERDGYLLLTDSTGSLVSLHGYYGYGFGSGWYWNVPLTVTATWGYRETPADVKAAVIELVLNLWRETDPATLNLLDLERQPLRERMPPRVAQVAQFYRAQQGVIV